MKFITILKIILHNMNFVKIIIVGPKNKNSYSKLNVPCFWNNYIIWTIIQDAKVPQRGSSQCPFTHCTLVDPQEIFFIHITKGK